MVWWDKVTSTTGTQTLNLLNHYKTRYNGPVNSPKLFRNDNSRRMLGLVGGEKLKTLKYKFLRKNSHRTPKKIKLDQTTSNRTLRTECQLYFRLCQHKQRR